MWKRGAVIHIEGIRGVFMEELGFQIVCEVEQILLQPGIQDASYVGSGKTNLPLELRGRAEDCSQVTAGQINLI